MNRFKLSKKNENHAMGVRTMLESYSHQKEMGISDHRYHINWPYWQLKFTFFAVCWLQLTVLILIKRLK